jgi:Putative auto-transporter adhesin, head GIN domain
LLRITLKSLFMKKSFLSLFLLFGLIISSFAQKTINDANAEKRNVASFHGIDVSTGIELILTKGTTEEVAVSASEIEYRNKIVTEVVNGILKIHYETKTGAINKVNQSKNLKAYVSYKALDQLKVTTGAEVQIDGVLEAKKLELTANTGGIVKGEVNIGDLNVDQNTGSKITLSGKVDNLEAEGDTGSKFMGENLNTNKCQVEMSTGAGLYISVEKELNVKANTGGYIKYKGNAGIREIKTNTGGTVSKI